MAEFEAVLKAFADATKKGSTTLTDKTLKKICTDAKITGKLDQNRVDIEWRKFLGNTKKEATPAEFCTFCDGLLAKAYADANKCDVEKAKGDIRSKIANASPKGHGTTAASKDGATNRLTDVSGYTGAHKERFNADGSGKGIEGREDRSDNSGYVGNYKNKDSYDKTH